MKLMVRARNRTSPLRRPRRVIRADFAFRTRGGFFLAPGDYEAITRARGTQYIDTFSGSATSILDVLCHANGPLRNSSKNTF